MLDKIYIKSIIFGSVLLFTGCGRLGCELQVRTEYVNVPTPCDIKIPQKPEFTEDVVDNTVNMMTYTDELEMALFCCTKDPRCISK